VGSLSAALSGKSLAAETRASLNVRKVTAPLVPRDEVRLLVDDLQFERMNDSVARHLFVATAIADAGAGACIGINARDCLTERFSGT
jgi:hypothetical protein